MAIASPSSNPMHIMNVPLTQLRQDNYINRKTKCLPIQQSLELISIVDGTEPCPSKFVPAALSVANDPPTPPTLNPTYLNWIKRDQQVLAWLANSLHDSLLTLVAGLINTSRDVCEALSHAFKSTSGARALHLRSCFLSMKKGSSTITEYIQEVKQLADSIWSPLVSPYPRLSSFSKFLRALVNYSHDDVHGLLLANEHFMQH